MALALLGTRIRELCALLIGSGLVSQSDGVVFVYRSHYEGLVSKRVRRLPDRTVLDWFRRGWVAAADPAAADLDAWVAAELGGRVYGLASIFDAAREHELPAHRTLIWDQRHLLRALREFEAFFNHHRPRQGIANARPLRPLPPPITDPDQIAHLDIRRHRRLGGILNEYDHACGVPKRGIGG
jgi:hypothetical protein